MSLASLRFVISIALESALGRGCVIAAEDLGFGRFPLGVKLFRNLKVNGFGGDIKRFVVVRTAGQALYFLIIWMIVSPRRTRSG